MENFEKIKNPLDVNPLDINPLDVNPADVEGIIALLDSYEGSRLKLRVVDTDTVPTQGAEFGTGNERIKGYVQGNSDGSFSTQASGFGGGVVEKQYHHGRCDVGSPWADGTCI